MPKNKKAKHNNHQAQRPTPYGSSRNDQHDGASGWLSHAEIWDDSALVRSWNEAVAEYQYYHSLAAQGLDIETVLDAAEQAEAKGEEAPLALKGGNGPGDDATTAATTRTPNRVAESEEEGEIADDFMAMDEQAPIDTTPTTANEVNGEQGTNQQHPTAAAKESASRQLDVTEGQDGDDGGTSTAPQEVGGDTVPATGTTDHTLENLKMAYYWAGYYSGLHDAQRQPQHGKDSAAA
ncbi:uncharacterized protein AB675_2913 [Cyphellophora attinorum]|uniref:Survival Motor Neuron Gemin2-binding domain-containing protein n=1 Tax=Cyphellophora attinorum TaxID=1664694 RepID=A0A0N0NJB6_9EURO|nr:uncharacterized protein AB675_2913 [Phialophora attinorum]KPI36429.1 hypothetical protein AB675_2913 [Phialophora attinorum]